MHDITYLRNIIDTRPLLPEPISLRERAKFWRDVEMEMIRLGFDKANKLTADSEILTERDYRVYINYWRDI